MKKNKLFPIFASILMLFSMSSCGATENEKIANKGIIAEETGAKYTVPDVTGKPPLEAAELLEKSGFTNVRSNISDKAELVAYEWIVVSQSVSAGESWVYDKPIILECKKQLHLYLDLKSEGNLIFSKYDVDVSVDGKTVGSVANGANFTYLVDVLDGTHEIRFNKAGDTSLSATKSIEMSDSTTFQCIIAHDSDSLDLKEQKVTQNVNGSALKVPDVVGKVLPEAKNEMKDTGFITVSSYADNDSIWTDDNWLVIEQNQEAGKALDKTTEIRLKCIKLDDYFEKEYVGKNLYEITAKAKASGFSLSIKNQDDYSDISVNGKSQEWLENWNAVRAYKYESKTARIYVKQVKAETQTTTSKAENKKTETTIAEKGLLAADNDAGKTNSTTVKADKETKATTSKTETTYLDNELKINYPRPSGTPALKKGSEGDEVGWLQTVLNMVLKTNDTVDCKFGNGTYSKVIEFQSRSGLQADGSVGKQTIEKLVEVATGREHLSVITTAKTESQKTTYTAPKEDKSIYTPPSNNTGGGSYVCNTNTGKFHKAGCSSVSQMNDSNKLYVSSREEAIAMGYDPCGRCHP